MNKHRITSACLAGFLLFLFQLPSAVGQLAPEVAKAGYADTIFVNGKIVSMGRCLHFDRGGECLPGHCGQE